jgi:hypothetical protein
MINLNSNDYVLYDIANDQVVSDSKNKVILYANKLEAINDCYGNEYIVPCTELPLHWQEEILNQINY